jgi:hypothetical protein
VLPRLRAGGSLNREGARPRAQLIGSRRPRSQILDQELYRALRTADREDAIPPLNSSNSSTL